MVEGEPRTISKNDASHPNIRLEIAAIGHYVQNVEMVCLREPMNAECTNEKPTAGAAPRSIEPAPDSHRVKFGPGALLFEAAVIVTMLLATFLIAARPFA